MSVHPAKRQRLLSHPKVARPAVVASDLVKVVSKPTFKGGVTEVQGEIKSEHPLAGVFAQWLGDANPTKRKAAAFLAQYPQLRRGAVAA